MATVPPSSLAVMPGRKEPIKEVNVNDVLLGRGLKLSGSPGNLAFRDLCDERKAEYKSTKLRKEKRKIAEEIRDEIHSRGGRFLKQDFQVDPVGNNVQEGFFIAHDDVVLEKCKQSLRENYRYVTESDNSDGGRGSEKGGDESPEPTVMPSSAVVSAEVPTKRDPVKRKVSDSSDTPKLPSESGSAQLPAMGRNDSASGPPPFQITGNQVHPIVPMTVLPQFSSGPMPSYVDPRLANFQTGQTTVPFAFQQTLALKLAHSSLFDSAQGLASPTSIGHLKQLNYTLGTSLPKAQGLPEAQEMQGSNQTDSAIGMTQSSVHMHDIPYYRKVNVTSSMDQGDSGQSASVQDQDIPEMVALPDESVSESFLHLLDLDSRQPRFTDEEEIREKETMSDTEKAAALSDLFGKMCIAPRQTKRCRNDLDDDSIQFLIKQMRLELEKIPNTNKFALVEAQAKAQSRTEEFSDARLEQFLRCEGMNAKLAALRFVNYWKYRQEVFGNAKYLMRMTLGEALADDLKAIEDGAFVLLPKRDVSGRQLVYFEPNRRTEGLYSSESLLRAIWYMMECTSQENTDISSGYVLVINHAHTTIWNYDRKALDRFQYYERSCLPVQCLSWQACCPNSVTMKVLKPIALALSDRRARLRTLIHDVPENEILNVLEEYGISKDMLPTGVGGDVIIDMPKWMANRRAVELEEI